MSSRPVRRLLVPLLVVVNVLLVLGIAAFVLFDPGTTVRYVIPPGSAARLAAGEAVDVIPHRLELSAGDRVVMVNQDSVNHEFGPLTARPGETVSYKFTDTGTFVGACTLDTAGQSEIVVK